MDLWTRPRMSRRAPPEAELSADAEGMLKSRDVILPSGKAGEEAVGKEVMRVAEVVAACLEHNGLLQVCSRQAATTSIDDLVKAASELELDVKEAELQEFLTRIQELGGGKESAQQMAGWKQLLQGGRKKERPDEGY